MFIEPTMNYLSKVLAENPTDESNKLIADQIEVISIFIEVLKCPDSDWENLNIQLLIYLLIKFGIDYSNFK